MDNREPGIYGSLCDSEYRAGGGLSSTLLRQFLAAPAKAHYMNSDKPEKEESISDVFLLGILCHAMVLEPHTVESRFGVMPKGLTRQTKAGKEAYAGLLEEVGPDGYVVKHDMMQHAIGVQESVLSHPRASRYFACGDAELSVFAKDIITDLLLCCRCDWLCRYPQVIVDLKTCINASAEAFSRDAVKHGYHLQAIHYLEVCRLAGIEVDDFMFVAVEKEPPYLCQVFRLSEVLKSWAYEQWREGVNHYAICNSEGVWPGYSDDVVDIVLPRWIS